MNPPSQDRLQLPPELRTRIGAFEARLRRVETVIAVAAALCGLLGAFGLVFAFDRLGDTPGPVRLGLALAGLAGLAFSAAYWGRRWIWGRRNDRALSRMIQRRFPKLGDRLLGAVELAEGGEHPGLGSPALRRAAVAQVAREATAYDFTRAVATRSARRVATAGLLLLAAVATVVWHFPQAGRNALLRWIRPLAPVERFTFVRIEDMPSELVVAHGEPFEIACAVRSGSRWRPERAACRVGRQPRIEAKVAGGRAVFRVPGQTQPDDLVLRIGDVSRSMRILPEHRPGLLALGARVHLPDYLRRPPVETPVQAGLLRVTEGSEVELEGRATRDLAAATMRGERPVPLAVTGAVFRTPRAALDGLAGLAASNDPPGALSLAWRDVHRLEAAAPYRLKVEAEPDAAPSLKCEGLGGSVAMLEDETVELKVKALDDFGLERLWAAWRVVDDGRARGLALERGESLAEGAPDRAEVDGAFRFSPVARGVPGDTTVELWACALDYKPGRAPSQSPVYRIYVLSRAKHAKLLEERAQAVQARLEEIRREEEALLARNTEVGERPDEQLAAEKSAAELGETERGERSDARHLAELSREMASLAREALRNRDLQEAEVMDWASLAEKMERLASGAMPQAADSMQSAQRSRAAPQRRESVQEAVARQKDILRQLGEMAREANESAENLAARNFINRLREAARKQDEMAAAIEAGLASSAGLLPDDLPPETVREAGRLTSVQRQNARDAAAIRDDLAGFFNRTRKAVYDEIRGEMAEPDVVARLNDVGGLVAGNLAGKSIAACRDLEGRFTAWAERLKPPEDGGGGGGGGGGQQPQVDPEVLFGLMRARVRQESLREATREVDAVREGNERHREDAGRLADRQNEIEGDLRKLNERVKQENVRRFMEAIEHEMVVSQATLRGPQTDAEAVAIQTGIIEAIAEALEAGSKGQSGGESSPEAMEALARMMQMMQGQQGGGSLAGGTTSRANSSQTGPGQGGAGEERTTGRGAGPDASRLPEEFRDAMQGYFHAIENPR
ncbi:MAG: hypothetical protein FJ221_17210 [Lentisphaerae bacterium]|nr:hypothetical protein [Lentisphaerota bacterium]